MVKFWICIIIVLGFLSSNCNSQSKAIADSCWRRYKKKDYEGDTAGLKLIAKVTFNQTCSDSVIFYSDYLIDQANLLSNSLFSAKGYYYKACGYRLASKYADAIDQLLKCIYIAQEINDEFLISCAYLEMGGVYGDLNNHKNAIASYLVALNKLSKVGTESALAGAMCNLGSEYLYVDNIDSALFFYFKADSLYSILEDDIGKVYSTGNIGIALFKKNRLAEARFRLKEACLLIKNGQFEDLEASYKLWLAKLEQREEKFAGSLRYSKESLDLSIKMNFKVQIRDSYEQLSNVYSAMGRYQEANEALKNYYAYRDSIVNTETITKIANLRTDFEVGQKQAELDVVRAQDSFKTKVAWFLAAVLLGVVVFLYIIYRHYRYGQRLAVLLKRQNHERQQQKIALEAAVAAKDRLFSVVAHDLRGPIGAMSNLVILANDAMANNEWGDLQSILIMMGDSNREVENLLNSLLHWSIGQRGTYTTKVEAVDFSRLVQSVIDVYLPIAFAKGVHISFVPLYEEHLIETDLNSWAVIVRNLVNNAVKFTHLGGVVTVTAQQYPDYLALKVSDTGIGMDPHLAQNVFSSSVNQSQWGTASEKGLGIGLSLVKDFVEMNDGQIQVESQLGQGTTFTVTIPVKVLKATPFVSEMV